jgi:site-specific recombinase XerD
VKYCHVRSSPRITPGWPPFLKALAREDLAAMAVSGYRSDLGLFAAWYEGYPLEKLTASDLAQFRHYLSRERAMKPAKQAIPTLAHGR